VGGLERVEGFITGGPISIGRGGYEDQQNEKSWGIQPQNDPETGKIDEFNMVKGCSKLRKIALGSEGR